MYTGGINMLKLRRVIGSLPNFLYQVECIEFLPKGEINKYKLEVNCSNTEMRRLIEQNHCEVWSGIEFIPCSLEVYERFIMRHTSNKCKTRKRKAA